MLSQIGWCFTSLCLGWQSICKQIRMDTVFLTFSMLQFGIDDDWDEKAEKWYPIYCNFQFLCNQTHWAMDMLVLRTTYGLQFVAHRNRSFACVILCLSSLEFKWCLRPCNLCFHFRGHNQSFRSQIVCFSVFLILEFGRTNDIQLFFFHVRFFMTNNLILEISFHLV